MIPIQDFQMQIPQSMLGKWKIKIHATSGKYKTCFENDLELVDNGE